MKVVLIIPYFGQFPSYFQLFLNSCSYNKDFQWFIYTDNTSYYRYPDNVTVKNMTFDEMKSRIVDKFDFNFEIESVHKLCDLKPAYGYIFEEDIQEYNFWGFCDMDVIWGNLKHFITDEMLEKYDKIYTVGHLTLFRNTTENNRRFMETFQGKEIYKQAFKKSREWIFDEGFNASINNIYEEHQYPMYMKFQCADIYTKSSNFRMVDLKNERELIVYENKKGVFWWKRGNLLYIYEENGKYIEKEFLYLHLQKRKMNQKNGVENSDSLLIVPNMFVVQTEDITRENFKYLKKKYFNMHYFVLRTKNLIYKIKAKAGLLD